MKKKTLALNAVLNGFRSVLNLLFPIITFPYVSRVLSMNGMGIYSFSMNYINYFTLIAGLGVATYAVREGAKYRDDRVKIGKFASQVFTINIYATIFSYALLFLSLFIFSNLHVYSLAILIFSIQILFNTIGTEWIYTIYEDYAYITIRSILFKVISLVLIFIFVKTPGDYIWYASITVFATVGSNILNFLHARSFSDIHLVRNPLWRKHITPILIIFASSAAVTIYVSSDTTILGILRDERAVGIYSIAIKIYSVSQSLLSALLIVAIPRLAMLFGKNKLREFHHVLERLINTLLIATLPATVGLIMMSKEMVLFVASSKYLAATNSLRIISFAIIFSIFSWIFSQCVLMPAKREKAILKNTLITAVVNVILNLILIPIWSYNGAALSTVIAEFMVMTMNGWSCRDIIKNIVISKRVEKNISTSLLGCLGIVIVCLICKFIFPTLIVRTVASILLSMIVYVLMLIVLKNDLILETIYKVRKNRRFFS